MPETYYTEDITSLLDTSSTSGTYRYFSYAVQNDFSKTKTFLGMTYLKNLENLGWKIYYLNSTFYAYKSITSVGTQNVSITPFERVNGNVLVIAGGGGGGGLHGGGGGAGGYIYETRSFSTSNVSVTVGAGGSGAPANQHSTRGYNGGNSAAGDLVAIGGGGGGTYNNNPSGASGGSGGGGAIGHSSGNGDNWSYNSNSQRGTPGYAVSGQGHRGGGGWHGSPGYPGGGGGGAGSEGGTRYGSDSGGAGGNGLQNDILGYNRYFAGGGGGWSHGYYGGTPGLGGAGQGAQGNLYTQIPLDAVASSGSGGGGVGHAQSYGGNGGSGIVVFRFPITYAAGGIGV